MTTNVFKFSVFTGVIIVAVVAAGWYLLAAPDGEPAALGRIEGTTSYPSEYLPSQRVCAEPVSGGEPVCADAPAGYAGELTPPWSIELPAGEYFVWASLADPSEVGSDFGDYRAYYTEFVRCGMEISCTDHSKIAVTVRSGESTGDVSPHDWYIR